MQIESGYRHQNNPDPIGVGVILLLLEDGLEPIKCNADERCPLRLDAAEP